MSSGDDLELGFNFETGCSLVNQIGTSGALWSVNTCLNSSVIQIGCLISLKIFLFFPRRQGSDVFQPRRRIVRAEQNSTDCLSRHLQKHQLLNNSVSVALIGE